MLLIKGNLPHFSLGNLAGVPEDDLKETLLRSNAGISRLFSIGEPHCIFYIFSRAEKVSIFFS